MTDDDACRLLAAIRSNAETAHVLAEIALGGDAATLMASLLPAAEREQAVEEALPEVADDKPQMPVAATAKDEKEATPPTPPTPPTPSMPAFLSHISTSFWD